MDSTAVEHLARINVEDLFISFGWEKWIPGRSLPERIFQSVGRRFARRVLAFDDDVQEFGLQSGAARFLQTYNRSLRITGQENIPLSGPVLIISNHPGMTDTVALFAALPRSDLKVIAAERPFLQALTATCRSLIFVPEETSARMQTLRAVAAHLRGGGAVLTFPAGKIEPDPASMPDALESVDHWSESIGFFARLAPDLAILPAIVSGVIAVPSLRHPLTRLRRRQLDRERLASALQLISDNYFPGRWPVDVQVRFAPPFSVASLKAPASDEITRSVVDYVKTFLTQEFPLPIPQLLATVSQSSHSS